jgi:hypothetical protein
MTRPPTEAVEQAAPEVSAEESADQSLRKLMELVQGSLPAPKFYREALRLIAAAMGTPFATLEVRLGGEVIEHECLGASSNTTFWRKNVQEFLTDTLTDGEPGAKLYRSAKLKTQLAFLGVPLVNADGRGIGALALVVSCQGAQEVREQLTFLHCLSLVCSIFQERKAGPPAAGAADGSGSPGAAGADGARVLNRLAGFRSPVELAFEITNKLRNKASCEQVALGRVGRKSVRLLSISGLDEIKHRSSQAQRIRAAMDECLDYGRPIVRQEGGTIKDRSRFLLHDAWRRSSGGACVASIPLALEGGRGAVLSLRRAASNPFSEKELEEVRGLVEPYVAGMDLVARAGRGLFKHTLAALHEGALDWLRPRRWFRKALVAGLAGLVAFLAFGTLPHNVSSPAVLVPGTVNNFSAPFDAILRTAHVVSGDQVEAGDLLCRFDTTDLELEQARLLSDVEVLRLRHKAALAEDVPLQGALLRTQIDQVETKLAIVERDIGRSSIHAPFGGIILSGDLRDRVGDQVIKGETLYRLSPERDWKLELEVPESEITFLEDGLKGRFASYARPEETHAFTIRRVRPSAEQRDGRTVYVVEAAIEFELDWRLAGMEGIARVESGDKPAWWVVFHGALDRMRLNFWL